MKKITILALIICSSLLFSACGPKKEIENTASTTPTSSSIEKKSTFSLKELLAKNIAQKCTWQASTEEGSTQGEIIISGNKFKQTTKITSPTGEIEINGVSDGEWLYTWSNDPTMGNMAFKMKIDQTQNQIGNDAQNTNNQVNWDQEFDYNCKPTTISESDLAIPKDIEFIDPNDLVKQFQQ
jgi:hypothetical protein